MMRILVLCEGQTEETFVRDVLGPHFQPTGKWLIPTCLVTKKLKTGHAFRGGVTSYARIRRDVLNLLRDSDAACVTTLLDYYALPPDFPGKPSLQGGTPYDRVKRLEDAFGADIGHPRFIPNLVLHEFEALLLVQPETIAEVMTQPAEAARFGDDFDRFASPEEINEGIHTHPSARIRGALSGYRKVLHGSLIAARIGLETIRRRCPHFDGWLSALEAL